LKNEVLQYLRVRPYTDADKRATALQLGTKTTLDGKTPLTYDEDNRVTALQLLTQIKYKGRCVDFTDIFENNFNLSLISTEKRDTDKEPWDPVKKRQEFFDKFQNEKAFLPDTLPNLKKQYAGKMFAMVNGALFPEFISYQDRGINVIPSSFFTIRNKIQFPMKIDKWDTADIFNPADKKDAGENYVGLPIAGKSPKLNVDEENDILDATFSFGPNPADKQSLLTSLKQQYGDKDNRKELITVANKWLAGEKSNWAAMTEEARKEANKVTEPTIDSFFEFYYKVRGAADTIGQNFVFTIWPTLKYFFQPFDKDPKKNQSKNIVTFFYGASGSGKTVSAEVILKEAFAKIKDDKDASYKIALVSDYNNDLFDYYSPNANAQYKYLQEYVKKATIYTGKSVGSIKVKQLQQIEMSMRSQMLTMVPSAFSTTNKIEMNDQVLFQADGSKNDSLKSLIDTISLDGPFGKSGIKVPTGVVPLPYGGFFEGNKFGPVSVIDPNTGKPTRTDYGTVKSASIPAVADIKVSKVDISLLDAKNLGNLGVLTSLNAMDIPKDDAGVDSLYKEMTNRINYFRSVSDTGLNPESSRSHLLYIIMKTEYKGVKIDVGLDKGSMFVVADFAGTEDLNYLLSQKAIDMLNGTDLNNAMKTQDPKWVDVKYDTPCTIGPKVDIKNWACIDKLPYIRPANEENAKSDIFKGFISQIVIGWKNMKIKTLKATEMSNFPAFPKADYFQKFMDAIQDKHETRLSKEYKTVEKPKEGADGIYFSDAGLMKIANSTKDEFIIDDSISRNTGRTKLMEVQLQEKNYGLGVDDDTFGISVNKAAEVYFDYSNIKEVAFVEADFEFINTKPDVKAAFLTSVGKPGTKQKTLVDNYVVLENPDRFSVKLPAIISSDSFKTGNSPSRLLWIGMPQEKRDYNNLVIYNLVMAMHAESGHINKSLKEITTLLDEQKKAVDATPDKSGKANCDDLVNSSKISKNIVTKILCPAVTAGSNAVTIGALNPRRTNDWDSFSTTELITKLLPGCVDGIKA